MNDEQEDRFGMFLKVQHFLGVNAAALAVNPEFAANKIILDNAIASIVTQDVIATTDISGYTIMKSNAEEALEEILLLVGRGLNGYYTTLGDEPMVRKVNYTKSEVLNARDGDLNTKAQQIHQIADPVKALLAANSVTAADVDLLNTSRVAFFAVISVPREKQGDSKAAREELVHLHSDLSEGLSNTLDNLMAVYESVNPVLFSKYQTARMIDNSGGGSGSEGYNLQNYTIPAGGSVLFVDTPLADREVYLRNLSPTNATICTTDGVSGPCASGYNLAGNTLFKNAFGALGLNPNLPKVQISNPGTEDVIVRAGVKEE